MPPPPLEVQSIARLPKSTFTIYPMNPVKQRDPQNFVMAILYANQVKNYLTSRNVKVEGDFTTRQALIGWMLDNPWLYAFLMQNEVSRLDPAPATQTNTGATPIAISSLVSNAQITAALKERMDAAIPALSQDVINTELANRIKEVIADLPPGAVNTELANRIKEVIADLPPGTVNTELANRIKEVIADLPSGAVNTELANRIKEVIADLPTGAVNTELKDRIAAAISTLPPETVTSELQARMAAAISTLPPETVTSELQARMAAAIPALSQEAVKAALLKAIDDAIPDLSQDNLIAELKTVIANAIGNLNLDNNFETKLKAALSEAVEKLNLTENFHATIEEVIDKAFRKLAEGLPKQLAELNEKYVEADRQARALTVEVNLLKEAENARQIRIEALEAERKNLDAALHAALERLSSHEHGPIAWEEKLLAVWKRLAAEIQQKEVFVAVEDGKVALSGLALQETPDSQNFKTGYLNLIKEHFEQEGIQLPPTATPTEAAWEKLTADLYRNEVYISLEKGKAVLMGLQLQGTPDSQNFKKGFLNYSRRYFEIPPGGNAPTEEAWTMLLDDLNRREVTVSIEDGKVMLAGLKFPKLPDDQQDFKKEYLNYMWRYFQPQEKNLETEKTSRSVLPGQPVPADENLLETIAPDDLTKILGIGKVIHTLLNQHGIFTFAQLSEKTEKELDAMLAETNLRLGNTNPEAWVEQAALLASDDREKWLAWKRDYRK